MAFETIWEDKGVYQHFTDTISPEDRIRANADVLGNARFDHIKYWLVDSLDSTEYQLDRMQALKAAGQDFGATELNDHVLMAFAATDPRHRENIECYKETLETGHSPWKVGLFDTLEDARDWISENS